MKTTTRQGTDSERCREPRNGCKYILVLPTTHHTLSAERALQSVNVRYLPVPKPQKAVSDCGLALQVEPGDLERASEAIRKKKMSLKVFVKGAHGEIEPLGPAAKEEEK